MRIFVTGGTGFVGSHFLNQALQAGHQVVALKRKGSAPRIPIIGEPQWLVKEMGKVEVADLHKIECVVHLAAHGVNCVKNEFSECLRWNVLEPCALFEKAADAGVRRFVIAGSCFEYGASGERYDFIPASAPLEPILPYSTSKAAATVAFEGFARSRKLEMLIARLFHVFGEGEAESRLWPSLRRAAQSGGDLQMTPARQVRDFTPVETVASVLLESLTRDDLEPGLPNIENVGTGKPQTVGEFAEYWWNRWNAQGKLLIGALPYRENEVMRYVPQIPKKCGEPG